jgi:hypothetical protein
LLAYLIASALAQDCPDAASALNDASEQLILLDEGQLAEDLDLVDQSFGCAWTDPDVLATWWLLRGAQRQLAGDEAATREAFAMAQSIAPDLWLGALGATLRAIYDDEKAKARPRSNLDLTGVGSATVRIDGKVRSLPVPLVPGTHLVQIGTGDTVEERRDVVIVVGQGAVIDLGRTEASVAEPKPPRDGRLVGFDLWGATGIGLAAGETIEANSEVEGATKVSVPLEVGAVLTVGPGWLRAHASWAPLLGGQLLYLSDNEVRSTGAFTQVGASAGASFAGFHAGALGAITIPSRTTFRGLVGRDIVGPLGVEVRGGANLHPARSAEPAFEVLVRFQPTL